MVVRGQTVAFVPARELARAEAFYVGVLGLTRKSRDDFALVLEANGVEIRVTAVPGYDPQPFTILGFDVANVEESVRALGSRGVEFRRYAGMEQDALGIWGAPSGSRIAWFADQDGNVLSLAEHPS